jgi:hypothetical protein
MNTPNQNTWKKKYFMFIPFAIMAALALSALVMVLWNYLMPDLFNLPTLNYWQASALLVFCRILFGGFHFKKPEGRKSTYENETLKNKFINMTNEEKTAFKEQWKSRCK